MQLLPRAPGHSFLEPGYHALGQPSGYMEKPRVGVRPTAFTEVTASASSPSRCVREGTLEVIFVTSP